MSLLVSIDLIPKEFNVIPVRKNSKISVGEWKIYQTKLYPHEKLKVHDGNVSVICGEISNNLLIIDPDFKYNNKTYFKNIYEKFKKEFPDLADTYIVSTPHGYHFYYYMNSSSIDRSTNVNKIFDKKKKMFVGTVKTNFFEYLKGLDFLGNNGYALIPPSELYEIEYINQDGVQKIEYEYEIDKKIIKKVIKRTLLKYEPYNNKKIKIIDSKQFELIKKFFLMDTIKQVREPFVDILNGKSSDGKVMEIESYSVKYGKDELLYWKGLFFEVYHQTGLQPKEIYSFLEANQPAFDKKKTEQQLKYHYNKPNGYWIDKKTGKKVPNKPFSDAKMKELFPSYTFDNDYIKSLLKGEIILKDLNVRKTFKSQDILKELDNIPENTTKNELIINIFKQIPTSEVAFKNQVKDILSNKLDFYGKKEINIILRRYFIPSGKIREDNSIDVDGDLKSEDFEKLAKKENYELGKIKNVINFDQEWILLSSTGISLYDVEGNFIKLMESPIELIYKTFDTEKNSISLFTFKFNDYLYRNYSLKQCLKLFSTYIILYNRKGKDVIKKIFTSVDLLAKIPTRNPCHILGWDDGWRLPMNEDVRNFSIITHTEKQEKVYNYIKEHSKEIPTKENAKSLQKMVKRFLDITQLEPQKLSMIIGWCISAPFRMFFIEHFHLFPFLYLCGDKITGKSSIADFFTTYLYKINASHLSPSVLNSNPQTEDMLAYSTFPISIQEISEIKDTKVIDSLKDQTTGNSYYFKMYSDGSIRAHRLKTGSVILDGNEPVEQFLDSAWNSKIIFIKFSQDEIIEYNKEWEDIMDYLSKENLFNLLYKYTEAWDNTIIRKRVSKIEKEYQKEISILNKIDQRLGKAYVIIMFGIELFGEVYDVDLFKEELAWYLEEGRTYLSEDLIDLFTIFIKECINLGVITQKGEIPRNLPNYLKHPLKISKKNKIVFTQSHLKDFEKLTGIKYKGLTKLYGLLLEGIKDKNLLEYKTAYSSYFGKSVKAIIVDEKLFDIED